MKLHGASAANIEHWLRSINEFNDTKDFGTTRVLFTPTEVAARTYFKEEMRRIGLTVAEDSIGNIFATLEGRDPSLAPVWTGSHIDTVLNAGMFDGMAGIVSGMEALRLIKESGVQPLRPISVVIYTSEEPTRFHLCCLGSRAMAGRLTQADTRRLTDDNGQTLYEVLQQLGYDVSQFDLIQKKKGDVFAAVELHIEQSCQLEKHQKTLGIVKTICAPTNYAAVAVGRQSHAGGTSMQDRQDAFAAVCAFAMELEQMARNADSEYTTATIGKVRVVPGASNVIPGRVEFSIDIRDCSFASKNRIMEQIDTSLARIGNERGVDFQLTLENHDVPMPCDPAIRTILKRNCEEEHAAYMELISGAYHDSMFVGEFAPVAMLFVPSKDGISHSPAEWTDFSDIATGTNVLANTLLELAQQS